MGQESLQILIVMVVYMAAVIGIGIFFAAARMQIRKSFSWAAGALARG